MLRQTCDSGLPENVDMENSSGIASPVLECCKETGDAVSQTNYAEGTGHPRLTRRPDQLPSYTEMIGTAILEGKPFRKTLQQIYSYIERRYATLPKRSTAWKNSVRHTLSLNECFTKDPRPDSGKLCDWKIHPNFIASFQRGKFKSKCRDRKRDVSTSHAIPYQTPFHEAPANFNVACRHQRIPPYPCICPECAPSLVPFGYVQQLHQHVKMPWLAAQLAVNPACNYGYTNETNWNRAGLLSSQTQRQPTLPIDHQDFLIDCYFDNFLHILNETN